MKIRRQVIDLIFIYFLLYPIIGYSAPTLTSVKKGGQKEKSWAVFGFDQEVSWIGINQMVDGKIALYFLGYTGEHRNKEVMIDEVYEDFIRIKQLSQTPPLFRAEISNQGDRPFAALKKNQNFILVFNDERFLDIAMSKDEKDEPLLSFAKLDDVSPKIIKDNYAVDFHFTGKYNWSGYIRHSSEQIKLIFSETQLDLDETMHYYDVGPLQSIQFVPNIDQISGLEAKVTFLSPSEFSIIRKNGDFLMQMPYHFPEVEMDYRQPEEQIMEEKPDSYEAIPTSQVDIQPDIQFQDDFPQTVTPQEPYDMVESEIPEDAAEEISEDGIPWNQTVPSLKFDETPIKDVLRFLAMSNELNMVIGEGLKNVITVNLENVTLKQALEKIIRTHACEYFVEDKIITVQTISTQFAGETITKIYRLNYADANNLSKIIQNIVTDPEKVEIFYPEFLDFTLAGLNRKAAGKVAVQGIRRASVLIVTDRPDKIITIDRIIGELDQPPGQVMIESKLVELSPEITNKLGIDWEESLDIIWSKNLVDESETSFSAVSSPEGKFQLYGQGQAGTLTPFQYAALMDVLKETKNTKLISYPRLLAMDNEESSISVGTTVPIPRIQRGVGTGDVVTFEYKEVNIQLNVSPHIQKNEDIIMYVNPVIEEITGWVEAGGSQAPITSKRMVNSIVIVDNGGTIVIGGLIKNKQVRTVRKVWLLGSLPLFGRLFQHENIEDLQSDLLIFITPTIVKTG